MFVDSVGGKWTFRATGRNLRQFEERTGIRLFQRIGDALPDNIMDIGQDTGGSIRISLKIVVSLFTSVLGGISDVLGLLYACREWAGDEKDDPKKIGFDDFCDRIASEKIGESIREATNILVGCVSGMTDGASLTVHTEDSPNPLGDSVGGTSTPSQG